MNNSEKQSILIHQFLHGYDEGHRLLGGSIKPDAQSAKTLLALSDLSGQGMAPGPGGYITGYPLPQMNSYALARTWLAPEMPRPGCVWTHTLLIDFSDLAIIGNVALLDLFQRPSSREDILAYHQTLVAATRTVIVRESLPYHIILALLDAVYEFPRYRIFVQMDDNLLADQVAMALWLQQWPRLQRNFRFCTWASSDRSRSDEPFDLQFNPQKRNIRVRSRGGNVGHWITIPDSTSGSPKKWTISVAQDIISGKHETALRKFLLRYGAETDAGRAAFKPLVQVWQALESNSGVDIVAAISAADEIRPAITSLSLRLINEVLKLSIDSAKLNSSALDFLVRNLPILGEEITEDQILDAAAVIYRNAPEHIWPLFRAESDVERAVAGAMAKFLKPEEALEGAEGDADLFCKVLGSNPKLATSPLVWNAPAPIPKRTAEFLSKHSFMDADILSAMLESENPEVPQIGMELYGQAAVNAAVERYDTDRDHRAHEWLLIANQEYLCNAVAQVRIRDIHTLAQIASSANYSCPIISKEGDEWVSAISSAQGDFSKQGFNFYAFLLARALSMVSPEPGSLIRLSFDFVHNDLLRSRSSREGWDILEPLLPEVSSWSSWDRAKRVRLGVVKAFLERGLPPDEFLQITKDDYVFGQLAEIAADSTAGRSYLEKVSWSIRQSSAQNASRRGKLIEDAVRRAKWLFW